MAKEAKARIKIINLLDEAAWSFDKSIDKQIRQEIRDSDKGIAMRKAEYGE